MGVRGPKTRANSSAVSKRRFNARMCRQERDGALAVEGVRPETAEIRLLQFRLRTAHVAPIVNKEDLLPIEADPNKLRVENEQGVLPALGFAADIADELVVRVFDGAFARKAPGASYSKITWP